MIKKIIVKTESNSFKIKTTDNLRTKLTEKKNLV